MPDSREIEQRKRWGQSGSDPCRPISSHDCKSPSRLQESRLSRGVWLPDTRAEYRTCRGEIQPCLHSCRQLMKKPLCTGAIIWTKNNTWKWLISSKHRQALCRGSHDNQALNRLCWNAARDRGEGRSGAATVTASRFPFLPPSSYLVPISPSFLLPLFSPLLPCSQWFFLSSSSFLSSSFFKILSPNFTLTKGHRPHWRGRGFWQPDLCLLVACDIMSGGAWMTVSC